MWEITARASTTPAWKGAGAAQEATTRKHSAENQVLHPFQTCSPGPLSLACLFTPITPALGAEARQEDQSEFKASLGYQGETVSQKTQTEQNNKKMPCKVIYTPMSQYLKERQVDQDSKASLGYLH